ncbi:hypothetical protein EYZ11_010957 [Aspergillus tanneri]|uniref:Uncharacterized protein n=1 Tax=Aspergillus tanneri TaxID=1220188 RepID=A0A4S3J407_9EURO|nr:uncharacterized protein ATNIH1004_006567 [Aspergillus tanneri]KAA8647865.1 hypothetical protein ATNIH1004_006567 [Aspergillus tanneri]THC89593.1 hypothetical protein EYZ11_010957 [Aspergillus tanneri]
MYVPLYDKSLQCGGAGTRRWTIDGPASTGMVSLLGGILVVWASSRWVQGFQLSHKRAFKEAGMLAAMAEENLTRQGSGVGVGVNEATTA